jgi:tetratricopeptide (TPR) repeat protein
MVLQAPQAISGDNWLNRRLARLPERKAPEEIRAANVALNPNFPTALTNLGNTLMHLGLLLEALELHERAVRLKPDYADAYCNRGMVELRIWHSEQALQSFERALAFQPKHQEALADRGMAPLELRNDAAAETALNTALAMKPGNAKVLAHRGRLHLRKRPTASSGGSIARHRPVDSTAWPEPFRDWPKAEGRPRAAIACQTGPFSRN